MIMPKMIGSTSARIWLTPAEQRQRSQLAVGLEIAPEDVHLSAAARAPPAAALSGLQ
jgi:hypothetical protein